MSEPWQRHRRPLPPLSFTLNSLPISHQRHTPFLSGRFNLATMFSLWGSDCSPSLHSLTQSASVAVSLLCTVHLYGLRRPGVSSTGKWACNNSQGGKAWPPAYQATFCYTRQALITDFLWLGPGNDGVEGVVWGLGEGDEVGIQDYEAYLI